jgi:choice-of-anchor C domain-containing protein
VRSAPFTSRDDDPTIMRLALSILALAASASVASAQITNGSFESASVNPGGSFTTHEVGNTDITGWTVYGANIDYIGTFWQASDGTRSLDLNGNQGFGGIFQSVTLEAGALYRLRFDQSANSSNTSTINVFFASSIDALGSASTASGSFDWMRPVGTTGMNWQTQTWDFTAGVSSGVLAFRSASGGSANGPALDNVRIEQLRGPQTSVPEPSTYVLMASGLAGLGMVARRRRTHA